MLMIPNVSTQLPPMKTPYYYRKISTPYPPGVNLTYPSISRKQCYFNSHVPSLLSVVHDYQLNETSINCKDHYKDLGVIFSHDLLWSKHISSIVAKAYTTLALIQRTFHHSTTSVSVRKTLYMSLIRSQLTYCSPVWGPHLIEDKRKSNAEQPSGSCRTIPQTTK